MLSWRAATVAGTVMLAVVVPATASQARGVDAIRDNQQWVLDMMDVPQAWAQSAGHGVTVAVIDSGVDGDVSDLAGSVTEGPDLTGLHTPSSDAGWGVHGTWMASIIAGHGHGDGSGIIGVAPDANILSIRVIPDHADPAYRSYDHELESRIQQSLAEAIRYAVRSGARVISMSIGYAVPSAAVRAALEFADARGVVVVASSGNSGADDAHFRRLAPVSFPADYPGVIGVAAVTSAGTVANFSSANLSVLVAAPGVDIPAQGRDGQYWLVSGTSPACALVAGVAALIKARYPALSPALVARALTYRTSDQPPHGYSVTVGFGTVNAESALHEAGLLARESPSAAGEVASKHFGGGAAAVPPAPVQPRTSADLIAFVLLAVLSLALTVAAASRIAVLRRSRLVAAYPPGGHAASFEYGPPPGGTDPRY
jgi:subtilisin family serine protease